MRIRNRKNKEQDLAEIAVKIKEYELDVPKLDIYRATIEVKKWWCWWLTWEMERHFTSFGDAYLWMLDKAVDFRKNARKGFNILGKNAEKTKHPKDWDNLPFNRMDCDEIEWTFNEKGELDGRYCYYWLGFSYMPSDVADDAGTHFKAGDLVKCFDRIYVITNSPGPKKRNRWENYYWGLEVFKSDDESVFSTYGNDFPEAHTVKFDGEIDKSSLLWYLHEIISELARGNSKMSEEEVWSYVAANVKLIDGEWKVVP